MPPPYERLEAWQASHQLALAAYRVSADWPASERYGLVSQFRRAAFSAASNLVEGSMRRGPREFRRFVDIALGSLSEVEYTLRFAMEAGVATTEQRATLEPLIARAGQLTFGLARALARSC